MSYHELSQDMATACSQAAFDYHPDCYCAFYFVHADYLPRPKYQHRPAKYLEVVVWRALPTEQPDRFVALAWDETGHGLLGKLRTSLGQLTAGTVPDPSLPPPAPPPPPRREPLRPPTGNGWIPTELQTTQPLTCWPTQQS